MRRWMKTKKRQGWLCKQQNFNCSNIRRLNKMCDKVWWWYIRIKVNTITWCKAIGVGGGILVKPLTLSCSMPPVPPTECKPFRQGELLSGRSPWRESPLRRQGFGCGDVIFEENFEQMPNIWKSFQAGDEELGKATLAPQTNRKLINWVAVLQYFAFHHQIVVRSSSWSYTTSAAAAAGVWQRQYQELEKTDIFNLICCQIKRTRYQTSQLRYQKIQLCCTINSVRFFDSAC